jgi:N-acetylmuramoyl-L-alanine amidase
MKKKTFPSSIICGLLLLFSWTYLGQVQAGQANSAKVVATSLNIRSEPGLRSTVVGSLPYGSVVSVSKESYGWSHITYDGASGWVAGYYLKKTDARDSAVKSTPPKANVRAASQESDAPRRGTVLADALRMRKGPGLDYGILHVLSMGTPVDITSRQNDWMQVKASGGKTGWVHASYVGRGKSSSPVKANRTPGLKGKVIVIDPGHGGNDVGAIGGKWGIEEKSLNMKTSRYVANRLRQLGAQVILTRSEDTEKPSLSERVEVSEGRDADAFISIHYNSSPKPVSGTLTFYYSENKDYLLASTIETQLARGLGLKSNGISFGDYHVLRENTRPSVLIELGFLSNPKDEPIIRTADYQKKAAKAIIEGLSLYFGK